MQRKQTKDFKTDVRDDIIYMVRTEHKQRLFTKTMKKGKCKTESRMKEKRRDRRKRKLA